MPKILNLLEQICKNAQIKSNKFRTLNYKYNFLEFLIFSFLFTVISFGQSPNTSDQTLRGSGRVNPSSLGMEIDIPLGSYPGRGINVPISLSYSSKLWRMKSLGSIDGGIVTGGCRSLSEAEFSEDSASGWTTSLATPYIEYTGKVNLFDTQGFPLDDGLCVNAPPPNNNNAAYIRRLTIHLPSGETHELRADDTPVVYSRSSSCPPANGYSCDPNSYWLQQNWDRTFYAVDGSNIKYIENSTSTPPTYKLLMPDGSAYDFASSLSSYNLKSVRKAERFTDRNGNFTSYNTTSGVWTDTFGRTFTAPIGTSAPSSPTASNAPLEYSMPGMTGKYKFHWKQLKGSSAAESALTDFNQDLKYTGDKISEGANGNWTVRPTGTYLFHSEWDSYVKSSSTVFNPVVLTQIELPTGQSYKFSYDIFGRIEKINYPTGGEEKFVYNAVAPLSQAEPGAVSDQANFGVTNRKLYPTTGQSTNYEWNYSVTYVAPSGYKISAISPDGTKNVRTLHRGNDACTGCTEGNFGYDTILAGMPYEEMSFSNTGDLVTRKLTSWTKTTFQNSRGEWHPRVTHQEATIYDLSGNGVTGTTKFEYEGDLSQRETPVLRKKVLEYAFMSIEGIGSVAPIDPDEPPDPDPTPVPTPTPPTLLRTTEYTYLINDTSVANRQNYKDRNMVGLVTASVVKDGAGTIVSRSEMKYDDSGYSPSDYVRGNPTTSRIWDSTKGLSTNPAAYIQTRAKFDSWGNQYETIDAKGNSMLTDYDLTYHTFPEKVTTPIPGNGTNGSNTAFFTTATFDPTTGLPLTMTDANGQTTTMEYDPVTLRPVRVIPPSGGGITETIYHDEPNNSWVKNRSQIDVNNWAEGITYFDGLGRAYKSEQIDSQGSIFVEKEFDSDGRVLRVSNPYRSGEVKQWTTNVYDESSRIKETILPDTSKVKTDYGVSISGVIGVTKQITDQAGKKRKGITDALGRMIRVIEDPDGQNLNTDYIFDTLGNLRKTIQGEQSRYFSYDSLGRLLRAKQPEQEINTNLALPTADQITGNNSWSAAYSYDDNGNILTTTDARGISVSGTYDNFNRIISRDYSDPGTPDVSFFYDGKYLDGNDVLKTASGSVKGKTTGIKSSVSRTNYTSFDNLGRLLTHQQITDGQTYSTSYTYNLSGTVLEETYPSGRVVKNVLNNDGELLMLQSKKNANSGFFTYAGNITYNSAGSVEKMRLGNGRWETATYNSRVQLTQIGLGTTDSSQDLLKLEYSYNTTGNTDNNGSLREQKIIVPTAGQTNGFTAIQTYSYDDLNRIQSATETVSGSQNWKQTFQYDRYGNRRFDANNTTTLLQSNNITNPTIDTATNRFSSGQNYLYDKNGNLTEDAEATEFLYDAENHQKEVKNAQDQTIGLYLYDGDGKRVKKISNTETTIFVYNGSGTLIAEYSTALSPTQQVSYLTQDHLGSPRIITNENGIVTNRKDYTAFGEEAYSGNRTSNLGYNNQTETRKGYTGYERDGESGLDFAQARYYNASHGRFTSVDPLVASAEIKNPQTFNRYAYVLNSPYKFSDPLGLLPQGWRDSTGGCGAEYSSCSDDYDPWEFRTEVDDSHTNDADATPATTSGSPEGGEPTQQEAKEPEPPPPPVDENTDSEDSPNSPTTSDTAQQQDTPEQARLRDYLMRSPVGHLIAEDGITFGVDGNGKVVADIEFTNPEKAIEILRDADDQFVNAHLGSEHNKEVGKNYDFRSYTTGDNRLGKRSLQINIGKESGRARADLDKFNPAQDAVGFFGHIGEVIGNLFK